MRAFVKKVLRRAGVDVVRYDERHVGALRRAAFMRRAGVTVVLDVGANDGPYARELRAHGYRGRIVSFEPQTSAYERLAAAAADDPLWEARRLAIGDHSGEGRLHLSANSSSSSLLELEQRHTDAAPESAYLSTEVVPLSTLDEAAEELIGPANRCLLKVDTQGTELAVLHGGARTLERSPLVEIELSLVPLYQSAPLLPEVVAYLQERGFALVGLEPVLVDPKDASVLQLDGLFSRVE